MSNVNQQASFSSANVFPAKLLRQVVKDKKNRIMPIHVQLNPTNHCNFNCPFCSCANRKRGEQMTLEDMKIIMKKARRCGCKSTTITGGGNPSLHPQINELIDYLHKIGIKIGLVDNGTGLPLIKDETMRKVTWCRISASDYLDKNLEHLKSSLDTWFLVILNKVKTCPNVDWAFSYVLTSEPNYKTIFRIIDFANAHNFTHVRIVSDLLDLDSVHMELLKDVIETAGIDDSKVIYQARQDFTKGTKRCLISLLKPVIGPDGKLYSCCGVQYKNEVPSKDYDITGCMGNAKDIDKIFATQKCFDGSKCVRCYYSDYNWSLDVITSKIKHEEFV